jgi:hypothetical protein
MSAPHGPIATADALQTLKPLGRAYQRIVLREEIGARAFQHITEVRVCGHRVKARTSPHLWECVADSDNRRTPGCGALFAVTYPGGRPTWISADTAEVTR